jgi:hypothetical protein
LGAGEHSPSLIACRWSHRARVAQRTLTASGDSPSSCQSSPAIPVSLRCNQPRWWWCVSAVHGPNPAGGVRATGGQDAGPDDLRRITDAILAGKITVPIAASFPIEQIRDAVTLQAGRPVGPGFGRHSDGVRTIRAQPDTRFCSAAGRTACQCRAGKAHASSPRVALKMFCGSSSGRPSTQARPRTSQ